MIYSRWGNRLEIVAYCGKHKPGWAARKGTALILVKVRYIDDGEESFAHVVNFKADDGWKEIDAAVDAAPHIELGVKDLKAALKEAE